MKPEQERENLLAEAQQCDTDALALGRRADLLEFFYKFPTAAQHLRAAVDALTKGSDAIRSHLRNQGE